MLKINVGLSRKVTEDYNSRGFSLNIEGELPSDVLHDEASLRSATDRLFQVANLMLDEQVERSTGTASANGRQPSHRGNHTNGYTNRTGGNGHTASRRFDSGGRSNGHNGNGNGQRTLTQAQSRAIGNIARKLNLQPDDWSEGQFGCRVNQLTVRQASEAIDQLKEQIDHEGVNQ